jgi:asparagine synthase (glutamine-hydrolysing)
VKTLIAVLHKKGENAIPILLTVLENTYPNSNKKCFGLATSSKIYTGASVKGLKTQGASSAVAVGFVYSGAEPPFNLPHLVTEKNATITFNGRIYSANPKKTSPNVVETKLPYPETAEAIASFLKNVEGDFSLFVTQESNILAARDPIGVEPLYFGEIKELNVLASNRKALWKLGVEEPRSFPPGHLGVVSREGFNFEPVKVLAFNEPEPISMNEAAKTLQELLEHSVQLRIFGQKKVAVAFSGGLDSSIIARLAKNCGSDVQLFHVSLKGQSETEEAIKAAKMLGLPLHVYLFTEAELENVISKVVDLIEEPDPSKAGVGVPFYWNAQKAAEAGFRVLLAGQGADELFGGYLRYVTEYMRDGNEKVRKTLFNDVAEIYESNLERDEKICGFHDVELRLPFASYQVVEFALSLPTELKFENAIDSLRKLVLRRTAENLGIPEEIVNKPKKAVQYSTGINSALRKLAKKQNCTLSEYINRIFIQTRKAN